MLNREHFKRILDVAKAENISFYEVLDEVYKDQSVTTGNKYEWHVFITSNPDVQRELNEYEKFLKERRRLEAGVTIEKNLLYAITHLVVPRKIELKKTVKKTIYVYPKDESGEINYSKTPIKATVSEEEIVQDKYISPKENLILKAIETLFTDSNTTGIVKSIIEAVKGLHSNNISADTFVNIINSMPLSQETKLAVISDNLKDIHNEPSFITAWGQNELDKKLDINTETL